ncbi:MAG: NblA/ycf18 family protein [Leptolyngbyaceae cyanobacterium]
MNTPGSLSLEQEFQLKVFREHIEKLTSDQAQELLLEVMRQLMLKDNWHTYKECCLQL